MKTVDEYKLIDGTFSIEEAERILVMLFNSKIDYHNLDDFSNHVRFNKNIENSKKRIIALKETIEVIKRRVSELKAQNVNLVINSTIKIDLQI